MLKKLRIVLFFLLASIFFLQVVPEITSAYNGGLLQGKSLTLGRSAFRNDATNNNQMTDNNLTTSGKLYKSDGTHPYAWYLFSEDVSINSVYVKSASTSLEMLVYDSNGTLISTIALPLKETSISFPTITNARRVALHNPSSVIVEVFEWDVYSNLKQPEVVTGLVATPGDTKVNLKWNGTADSEVTGYNVKRSTTSGGPYTTVASEVTDTAYEDRNVTNGVTYYYVVTAITASSESNNSNEDSVTPQIPAPSAPINLTATTSNGQVALTWDHSTNATGYTVLRSTYSGGPYTAVASVTSTTYTNIGLENGKTYYYVVQATNAGGASGYSNEFTAILPSLHPVIDIVITEEKLRVGQEFTSNIILKNTTNIYAEDFTIHYDNTHLEYLGFEEVPGYKVYNTPIDSNGKLRFVVASQGASYGINAETTFLKLKFKAKAVGNGKVDATKARIADTTVEFDLEEANCLEDSVIIENQDVNMSGEYTLLDLAIDAAHFGELGSTVDPTKYVANQVGDDTIRDEDLVFIVAQMLANTNYAPNNK